MFLSHGSGPREDATRIGSAGVVRRQAVDISPLRRVNQAIFLLTTGARESAFRNVKTIAECLACVAVMLFRRRTRLNKLPRQIVEEGLWYLFLVVYLGFCEEHL